MTRRERLRALMDEYRCWPWDHPNGAKNKDYDDSYAELAAEALGVEVNYLGHEVPIAGFADEFPWRYAALRCDETYSMIQLAKTLPEAIAAESSMVGQEYLMNPAGVIDLETGVRIETVTVGLSAEAFTVLCGLVQPNWLTCGPELEPVAVNHGGIYTDAWEELQATFPLDTFRKAAKERGEDFYHEEAGL